MGAWTWYAADLKTGYVATRLPLTPSSSPAKLLGAIGSANFNLPVTDRECPAGWEQVTEAGRTVIAGTVADANGYERLVWSGIVLRRVRSLNGVNVGLVCSSIETYLERRYVDSTLGPFVNADQHHVFAALIGHANTSGIGLLVDAPDSGVLRDRTEYYRYSDQQIYAMVDNLAKVEDGPEWTIRTSFAADEPKRLAFTAMARTPYIGAVVDPPPWVFSAPGNITELEYVEGYGDGEYANVAVAGGTGDGTARIMSTSGLAQDTAQLAAGWPLMESRVSDSNLTTQESVDALALGELASVRAGAHTIRVTIRTDDLPLGELWGLGDTAAVRVEAWDQASQRGAAQFPSGLDSTWRITGWELDQGGDSIKPTLMAWPPPGEA